MRAHFLCIVLMLSFGIVLQAQDEGFFVPYPNIGDTTFYYEIGNPESIRYEMFETPQEYYLNQALAPCHINSSTVVNEEGEYLWKRGLQEYHFKGKGTKLNFNYAVVKDVFKNTWSRMELEGQPSIFNDISSMSTYRTMNLKGSYSYNLSNLDEELQEILEGTGATALWVSFALNVKYERIGTTKIILPKEDINCLTLKNTEFYIPTGFQIYVDGQWQKMDGETQMKVLDQFAPVTVPKIHYIDNSQKREVAQINIDPANKDKFVAGHYMFREAFKYLLKCNEESGVYLFPNPSYGVFNIKMYNYPEGDYQLKVYNIVGKLIRTIDLEMAGNRMVPIVLNGIQKGTYIYSIVNEDGTRIDTKRLLIMGL